MQMIHFVWFSNNVRRPQRVWRLDNRVKIVGFDGYYSKESSILHAAALELKIIVFVKTPKNSS